MSSDDADVHLLNAEGKSSQPVQHTSARVPKPNSSLDHKGASLEQI